MSSAIPNPCLNEKILAGMEKSYPKYSARFLTEAAIGRKRWIGLELSLSPSDFSLPFYR